MSSRTPPAPASATCPACGLPVTVTNRGELARHGSVRIARGRREVACLLSGSRASFTREEHAAELEHHASRMIELAATPGTTPKDASFYTAAAARAREVAAHVLRIAAMIAARRQHP